MAGLFWVLWRPQTRFFVYNVPIAVPFAAFVLDRSDPRHPAARAGLALDALVVALALCRVFVPPFPFVSGHALFTTYAALSARGWVLRTTAALVVVQVAHFKLFVSGGWQSLVGGLAAAILAAAVRRRLARRRVLGRRP